MINIIVCEEINNSTNDNMLQTAKEKFFKREQKYLAGKPFSSELHEMIKRFKGRKFEARNKRGGSSTTEIEYIEHFFLVFNFLNIFFKVSSKIA